MHRHRVLVVDDHEDVRDLMIVMLRVSEIDAAGVCNGEEALGYLRGESEQPCVILLDLMMPIMDGPTFREEQLEDPALAHIPIIVLSARGDVPEVARQMNAQAYARKPLGVEELLALVQQACKAAGSSGDG